MLVLFPVHVLEVGRVGMKMNEGWCKNGISAEPAWLYQKHNRTRFEY